MKFRIDIPGLIDSHVARLLCIFLSRTDNALTFRYPFLIECVDGML